MIPVEPTAEVPMPFDLTDQEPATHKDAVAVAVNTANLIEQLGGGLDFNNEDLSKAQKLVVGQEKPNKPTHITAPSEAAAAHQIIRRYDFATFQDAMQARNFITNKLVKLADCGDPKLELKALELLGKHSDIGLFTDRSEITIHHTSSSALENSIKERIKRLLHSDVVDVATDLVDELDVLDKKKQEKVEDVEEISAQEPKSDDPSE
jgi:hypothetical protein